MNPLEIALQRIEECRRTRSTELDLSKLELTEIPEQVFELTWLEELDVSRDPCWELSDSSVINKGITSIPVSISQLNMLKAFKFNSNKISDLSSLSVLTKIRALEFNNNKVSDLSSLSALTEIRLLKFNNNKISDLSSLSALTKIQVLECHSNRIFDISPLTHLPRLRILICFQNIIDDVSPLQNLQNLERLECSSNKIYNLSALCNMLKLEFIYCTHCKITSLNLNNLPKLKSIRCRKNKIEYLELSNLPQLKELDCEHNKINKLNLSELPLLEQINLQRNEITDISTFNNLKCLEQINLSENRITDISALKHLKSLESINFRCNEISNIEPFEELENLQSLDIAKNKISNILPLAKLFSNKKPLKLFLHGNHAFKRIPQSLMGKLPILPLLFGIESESLKNYLLDIVKSGSSFQRRFKVQLIGNGRVGKSTLADALKHKCAHSEPFKSTHGIVIKEIQQALDGEDEPVTLQLWDFGGQEIYHATHRLFLSDDCLYLLLWSEKTEEHPEETRHPVSYWLELIHDLAPNSQVIVVKNQIDLYKKLPLEPLDLTVDVPGYKQICEFVKISALKYQGMYMLEGAIKEVLRDPKLQICLELPTSWLQVQRELKQLDQKTIPFADFKQLCIKAGIDHAEWFVDYLHKTGVLFYRKAAFQDQIIIDQNWVIEAAYRVFDPKGHRGLVEQMQGSFKGAYTQIFWPDANETERNIYLDFMRNCGICYEPNRKHDTPFAERTFIIPALLPEDSTACAAWHKSDKDWQLDIEYPFLHRSIIERIILHLGETYPGKPWRTGIFCNTEYGQVLLECTYHDKKQSTQGQLSFHLHGNQLAPLVYALRKLVSEISPHRRYQEFLQQSKTNRAALPEFKAAEEKFSSRLDPIEPTKTIKLFISYSRKDYGHKLTLERHLRLIQSALKHRVKLEIWSDNRMQAGDSVSDQILPELRHADLIVLLVSPDFLDPERYSRRVELPIALERHEKESIPVIPVLVRHTAYWYETLGNLTVATHENADSLEDWALDGKFWGSVETGIRKQVEKLGKC